MQNFINTFNALSDIQQIAIVFQVIACALVVLSAMFILVLQFSQIAKIAYYLVMQEYYSLRSILAYHVKCTRYEGMFKSTPFNVARSYKYRLLKKESIKNLVD